MKTIGQQIAEQVLTVEQANKGVSSVYGFCVKFSPEEGLCIEDDPSHYRWHADECIARMRASLANLIDEAVKATGEKPFPRYFTYAMRDCVWCMDSETLGRFFSSSGDVLKSTYSIPQLDRRDDVIEITRDEAERIMPKAVKP